MVSSACLRRRVLLTLLPPPGAVFRPRLPLMGALRSPDAGRRTVPLSMSLREKVRRATSILSTDSSKAGMIDQVPERLLDDTAWLVRLSDERCEPRDQDVVSLTRIGLAPGLPDHLLKSRKAAVGRNRAPEPRAFVADTHAGPNWPRQHTAVPVKKASDSGRFRVGIGELPQKLLDFRHRTERAILGWRILWTFKRFVQARVFR